MYRSLGNATDEKMSANWSSNNCQISYLIKPVLPKDTDFDRAPYLKDYKNWTDATISELGCEPIHAGPNVVPDITLVITDVPLPNQYAQGERFLATFTLYLIPIPMDEVGYRKYEFSSHVGPTRNVSVIQKGWLGWIFVPLFPFSFSSYSEQGVFKSQLREYLSGKENLTLFSTGPDAV